ncbi:hypothetical protein EJB05_28880, partial [Eragrostis curvula]
MGERTPKQSHTNMSPIMPNGPHPRSTNTIARDQKLAYVDQFVLSNDAESSVARHPDFISPWDAALEAKLFAAGTILISSLPDVLLDSSLLYTFKSLDQAEFIVNKDLELCPTFPKLKTLLLSEWCPGIAADLNMLACFLRQLPVLEKLTLEISKVPKVRVQTERSFQPFEQSFLCNRLKKVEIKCEVDGRVHEALSILSSCGIPLTQFKIQDTNKTSGH